VTDGHPEFHPRALDYQVVDVEGPVMLYEPKR